MSAVQKNTKVISQIIEDLKLSDEKAILKTLEKVRDKGNVNLMRPLFEQFESTESDKVKHEIKSIFCDLKDSYALEIMIEELKTGSDSLNEAILYALWNNNLNPVEFIPELVEAAKNGNYMIALETLTVIENLDGPYSNEKLMEAQFILNEYFTESLDEKESIMRSILEVILSFEDSAF